MSWTMRVECDGQEVELPPGSCVKDLAEKLSVKVATKQALGALVGGVVCDLCHPINEGDVVEILGFEHPEGKALFWHTSAHVLAQAVLRLYPDAMATIGPPIEQGFYYDFAQLQLSEEDFPKIEKEVKTILRENLRPERICFGGKKEAIKAFGDNPYKVELIEGLEEGSLIFAYRQGEFIDLCLGPHIQDLKRIQAFKVLKTSGAYWRGDPQRGMLTRIYAISFPEKEMLKSYLHKVEMAKKRDHREIGAKQGLFSFEEVSPAMPLFHPRGEAIWNNLVTFWREKQLSHHYEIIQTPQLMLRELWERSGHWEHYRKQMFVVDLEEKRSSYAIKPMNCLGCILYYKRGAHSYREFPLRIAELGHVHRREPSGALNGLFRVQSFHQDDAHLFMMDGQVEDEIINILKLANEIYQTFGLRCSFELSTRPEKFIGSKGNWETATAKLRCALDRCGKPYTINEGDGAFYGPKIDMHIYDALGRKWQCGTIQLDMAFPEKFGLEYKDSNGEIKRPVMIHRAIFGSMERFFAILIEHFAGKFPFWISPLPIQIIPVADRHISYSNDVLSLIRESGFLCTINQDTESLGKRVRSAQLLQINYMLTIGDREMKNRTVNLRTRDNVVHGEIDIATFLNRCAAEARQRLLTSPFCSNEE